MTTENRRYDPNEYQDVATAAQVATLTFMAGIVGEHMQSLGLKPGDRYDAGPMFQGVVAGAVQFMMEGGATGQEMTSSMRSVIDNIVPQMEMALVARNAGSPENGRA